MAEAAKKKRTWVSFVPFFVLMIFFVLAFVYQGNLDARATIGEVAPDFELVRLDGGVARLSDFQGQAVVLNFWTTWCTECRTEMPALESIHQSHQDVAVIGVNMRESARQAQAFVDEHNVSYPILLDQNKRVAKSYRVTGVPETWIIAANGVAVERFIGPVTARQIEHALRGAAELVSYEGKVGKGEGERGS